MTLLWRQGSRVSDVHTLTHRARPQHRTCYTASIGITRVRVCVFPWLHFCAFVRMLVCVCCVCVCVWLYFCVRICFVACVCICVSESECVPSICVPLTPLKHFHRNHLYIYFLYIIHFFSPHHAFVPMTTLCNSCVHVLGSLVLVCASVRGSQLYPRARSHSRLITGGRLSLTTFVGAGPLSLLIYRVLFEFISLLLGRSVVNRTRTLVRIYRKFV